MKQNIYVIGMDAYNEGILNNSKLVERYQYHPLLTLKQVKGSNEHYPVQRLWQQIDETINKIDGTIEGIIGFWDFPVTCLQAMICKRLDLTAPALEQVLKCEHKYWSRELQREVIPEATPVYELVDPFNTDENYRPELPYPFWLKPIKSAGSYLGFKIHNEHSLRVALDTIRNEINSIAGPFNFIMDQAELPEPIANVPGHYCLAESTLTGKMCTVEGYVYNNEVYIHGIIASVKDLFGHSFFYYRYPLEPTEVIKSKMEDYTNKVIKHIGLNNSAFNIEYFYDEITEDVHLLEINPRISQSHAYIFQQVDGLPNHAVISQLALGEKPDFPKGQGQYRQAGKFFLRYYQDGWVYHLPNAEAVKAAERTVPGSQIHLEVNENMWLSELTEQDSYSYEVAHIFTVGDSEEELLQNYHKIVDALSIDIH